MFERFDPAARRTVVLAQEQARFLDHDYIGTEHLVLALLADSGNNTAKQVLVGLGITHARFEDEILAIVGRGEGAGPGHIPFTPRSKKVLELSLREALRLKSKSIGPEHILLGLIREGEGLAAQILVKLGADLTRLKDELEGRLPAIEGGIRRRRFRGSEPQRAARSMTPGGSRVAERAISLAGGSPVGSHHYLLAVLDEEDGLAASALDTLGVTREAVEAKLAELALDGTSDEPPERAGARRTSVEVVGDAIAVRIEEPDLANRLLEHMNRMQVAVLRGVEFPGSERIWTAVQPALRDVVSQLEAADWTPPGWSQDGAAAFAVVTSPQGPRTKLWVADGVDEHEVRQLLTAWLPAKASDPDLASFLTVAVGRQGDELRVTRWSFGSDTTVPGSPITPLADLVAFGLSDLERAA